MEQRSSRRGIAWELVGILAVLAVILVGILIWLFSPQSRGELRPPQARTVGSQLNLASGVTDDGRPYLGSEDAPVTFYEFGDFQCPHCGQFARELSEPIKADYLATGKARMVWVNFPVYGDESVAAAKAAICAGEQGLFWQMHDWLFANQSRVPESGNLSPERLLAIAEAAGADTTALETCLEAPETGDRLAADQDFGNENGVGSTPTFLVGDRIVAGTDIEELRAALDAVASE